MERNKSIKKQIEQIHELQNRKAELERAVDRAEDILRDVLYNCHDILVLSKKIGMTRYMDEEIEISGSDEITVKIKGKVALLGAVRPKLGGLHLIINKSTPQVVRESFVARLHNIEKRLQSELEYTKKLERKTEDEKLILERDKIEKNLLTEVGSLETKAKRLGVTRSFIEQKK